MNTSNLWSLRLGFSGKQSSLIEKDFKNFLKKSFDSKIDTSIPEALIDSPKTTEDLKAKRDYLKNADPTEKKKYITEENKVNLELKAWWLEKMATEELPLREKMTCFWHNHYVATFQKVKVNYWVYQHNQLLRENAFGNFRELTKKVLRTNAIVRYLDNTDNKKGKTNENLSRELLELFTLGVGNYTEEDIKNGAKALAGLGNGNEQAVYREKFQDGDTLTYLGKTGKFKSDDLVDIIFEQKSIPYFITRKILKWFIYDNPTEELVAYYGDYFRKKDFEIAPLLTKIFTEEYKKSNAGNKIKDPLVYIFQLFHELNIANPNMKMVAFFLREQGMDLFNQPNVKGWNGGNNWLTSQIFLQRNTVSDMLCNGRIINKQGLNTEMLKSNPELEKIAIKLNWEKTGNNKTIIAALKNRLLFTADENLQKDFENILKYDFNPQDPGADNAVLRVFNAMTKAPEFQLI
ncbi:DUF1800 domain-containing protein [uncultured Flavobacterium sp.]|uniref:DUF1800 domain-containing protein n=1 Tax=uncultured Flavobacterium sp. TaxID=165435 RepID=UPI0025E79ED2|nr:DUF1800 domain-containing protein [uncultured Flavobacterium sp.]